MYTNPVIARLSLAARLAVALHCFNHYCHARGVAAPEIIEFLDYLWEFPSIPGPDAFGAWESRYPILVDVGLGAAFPERFELLLHTAGVAPPTFRTLLEDSVEIVFGSFYGAADDHGSATHLQRVLDRTKQAGILPPPLALFAHSRFADRHGWGNRLSDAERDRWRYLSEAND